MVSIERMSSSHDSIFLRVQKKISDSPELLRPSGLKNTQVKVLIGDSKAWSFVFDAEGNCRLTQEASLEACSLEIETDAKTFEGLVNGSANIAMAMMFRKIKLRGDIAVAAEFGRSLKRALA
jgi:putative sterol carrier protein